MACFLVVAAQRLGRDRMIRVVVPGEIELRLNEPGTYTIFHEYQLDLRGPRL